MNEQQYAEELSAAKIEYESAIEFGYNKYQEAFGSLTALKEYYLLERAAWEQYSRRLDDAKKLLSSNKSVY